MALIKTANSPRLVKDAVVLDLAALDRQADRILAVTRAQADQILAEARAEAKQLTDNADGRGHAEGHERGLAEGREAGRDSGHAAAIEQTIADVQQITAAWTAALDSWERDRAAMQQEAGEDMLRLAFAIAEKIVHRVVQQDATIVRDQVKAAISLVGRPTELVVSIHPDDRAQVQELLPELTARLSECKHIALTDDSTVERGGCRIRTRGGMIDATVKTQMMRIAESLLPENPNLNIDPATISVRGESS